MSKTEMPATSSYPVSENTTYTFRVPLNVISTGAAGLRLQINWYDASGETVFTDATPFTRGLGERQLTLRATSPAGAAYAVVFIGGFGALNEGEVVEFYVDAVQLVAA
jgi:hypothetical protein